MRIRVKFAKYDTLRFIGHLDVMRYVQRLIRRSKLPVKYSDGFHPHPILSFAQPLGLGLTSDGEYFDTELDYDLAPDFIRDSLKSNVSDGFEIIDVVKLSDREVNKKLITAMSLITRSAYLIILKDEGAQKLADSYDAAGKLLSVRLKDFLSLPEIKVIKKSKKSEREIELKKYIYEVNDVSNGCEVIYKAEAANGVINDELLFSGRIHAPEYDNGCVLAISLSAGSETNISPEYFMECFLNHFKSSLSPDDFRYHRMELYGNEPKESKPLCQILL